MAAASSSTAPLLDPDLRASNGGIRCDRRRCSAGQTRPRRGGLKRGNGASNCSPPTLNRILNSLAAPEQDEFLVQSGYAGIIFRHEFARWMLFAANVRVARLGAGARGRALVVDLRGRNPQDRAAECGDALAPPVSAGQPCERRADESTPLQDAFLTEVESIEPPLVLVMRRSQSPFRRRPTACYPPSSQLHSMRQSTNCWARGRGLALLRGTRHARGVAIEIRGVSGPR